MAINKTPNKIKIIFGMTLVAMLAVLVVLINFTFKQLENDSLLRIREQADSLFYNTNKNFISFIKKEEARSANEYDKKVISQEPILGYFQISNFEFSSTIDEEKRKKQYEKFLEKLVNIKIDKSTIPKEFKSQIIKDIKSISNSVSKISRPTPRPMKAPSKTSKKFLKFKGKVKKFIPTKRTKKKIRFKAQSYDKGKFIILVTQERDLFFLRKVYVRGLRFLQGFIVPAKDLVEKVLIKDYQGSTISQFAWPRLSYGKEKTLFYNGIPNHEIKYYMGEALDHFATSLRFDLHIHKIPRSSSTNYFIVLSSICGLIIILGFLVFYHFSLAQLKLAQERSNFVSAVGHELKTPLTSITMYSEMLRDGLVLEKEKQTQYYDFILAESSRLSRLINNILRLSHINNDNLKPKLEIINIEKIRKEIENKTKPLLTRKDFSFTYKYSANEEKEVKVDLDFLSQILINVIDNGIKFSKDAQKKVIEIGIDNNSNDFILTIRDFGKGIDKDKSSRLFELFYRPENELTRTTKGTGIGLALVKELAIAMNGKVTLKPESPGTRFTLTLPLEPGTI